MKSDKLVDAIGGVRDEYLMAARTSTKTANARQNVSIKGIAAGVLIAACVCGVAFLALWQAGLFATASEKTYPRHAVMEADVLSDEDVADIINCLDTFWYGIGTETYVGILTDAEELQLTAPVPYYVYENGAFEQTGETVIVFEHGIPAADVARFGLDGRFDNSFNSAVDTVFTEGYTWNNSMTTGLGAFIADSTTHHLCFISASAGVIAYDGVVAALIEGSTPNSCGFINPDHIKDVPGIDELELCDLDIRETVAR